MLEFHPRDEYDEIRFRQRTEGTTDVSQLTTLELFNKLHERSVSDLSKLLRFYKTTGGWNITSEKLMQRVCEDIKAICASVAGEGNHGSKK